MLGQTAWSTFVPTDAGLDDHQWLSRAGHDRAHQPVIWEPHPLLPTGPHPDPTRVPP